MNFFEKFKSFFLIKDWFKEGLEDFCYNVLGNFLPIWVLLIINIIESGFNTENVYKALHQPYTYLILSGTYLTSISYLQTKPKMDNKLLKFFYFPLLIIIGLLVAKKNILEDLTAPAYLEWIVVIVFLLCFIVNTYLLFYSHYQRLNVNPLEEQEEQRNELYEQFDKTE
ncbi:hypothetical protein OBJ96_04095 [Empedobacter falsenii]